MQVYNDELKHFGIPGMHWGRRKGPSTKVMRADRRTIGKKENEKAMKKYDIAGKRKRVLDYAEKNKLDFDGGGGSSKAGRNYNKAMATVDKMESLAYKEAGQKTAQKMVDKYGVENIKRLNRSESLRVAAGMAAVIAIPAAIVGSAIASDLR